MSTNKEFDYARAFDSNIGWVTPSEQKMLRRSHVAIGGCGGAGGAYAVAGARLGVGHLNLADFDRFELHNIQRQAGARMNTLGQSKVKVMAKMAQEINPGLEVRQFARGISSDNLADFLEDVDIYLDGLDAFELDIRAKVFAACYRRNIPAITVAPLGMGASMLIFLPGKMSFEQYFRLEGYSEQERALRLICGVAPTMLQMKYLVWPEAVDFAAKKGPSTVMGIELCAGLALTNALKILLGRGPVPVAPHGVQFDAYRNKLKRFWRPGGNANPMQKLMLAIARRRLLSHK